MFTIFPGLPTVSRWDTRAAGCFYYYIGLQARCKNTCTKRVFPLSHRTTWLRPPVSFNSLSTNRIASLPPRQTLPRPFNNPLALVVFLIKFGHRQFRFINRLHRAQLFLGNTRPLTKKLAAIEWTKIINETSIGPACTLRAHVLIII